MSDVWKKLQPIKVASGWTIGFNNFYCFEPTTDNMEWFYGSYLLTAHHEKSGFSFDSRYEPEGDPKGEYVVDFFKRIKKTDEWELLGRKSTKSKEEFIKIIEEFMFTRNFG